VIWKPQQLPPIIHVAVDQATIFPITSPQRKGGVQDCVWLDSGFRRDDGLRDLYRTSESHRAKIGGKQKGFVSKIL
jgi:hypothetical protein